jgi:hypothetical protein
MVRTTGQPRRIERSYRALRCGGHRLRVAERDVMRHSRHLSVAVFRGYVRDIGLFDASAAAVAGL